MLTRTVEQLIKRNIVGLAKLGGKMTEAAIKNFLGLPNNYGVVLEERRKIVGFMLYSYSPTRIIVKEIYAPDTDGYAALGEYIKGDMNTPLVGRGPWRIGLAIEPDAAGSKDVIGGLEAVDWSLVTAPPFDREQHEMRDSAAESRIMFTCAVPEGTVYTGIGE